MQFKNKKGVLITVYSPNERQGGIVWALRQAAHDVYSSWDVIVRLFMRDFVGQFRQRLLGYLWALLLPLLSIISFVFLYFAGVLNPGVEDIPYPLYALVGNSIWACLVGTVGAVSAGLQAQADLIMRTNIPKLGLAISSLASILYGLMVGMFTMVLLFLMYGKAPSWWMLAYPLLVLPMLMIGTTLGLVLSAVGAIVKDASQIVIQGLSLLMYATPVIYLADTVSSPLARKIIALNPLTYLVDVPRSLICTGSANNVDLYLLNFLGVTVLSLFALRAFYLVQDLVAERL